MEPAPITYEGYSILPSDLVIELMNIVFTLPTELFQTILLVSSYIIVVAIT